MRRKICNNCNCDDWSRDRCSILGHMPIGYCCEKCELYDESHTCLKTNSRGWSKEKSIEMKSELAGIKPVTTLIEDGVLKVVLEQNGKQFPISIDISKQLGIE